jgi:hypothetical protein
LGFSSGPPKKDSASSTTKITPATTQNARVLNQPSRLPTRKVATATIQTSEIGISQRQPNRMNWS